MNHSWLFTKPSTLKQPKLTILKNLIYTICCKFWKTIILIVFNFVNTLLSQNLIKYLLTHLSPFVNFSNFGAVAQLGERMTGSHEVDGSIPFSSTKHLKKVGLGDRPFFIWLSRFLFYPWHLKSISLKNHVLFLKQSSAGWSIIRWCRTIWTL